MAFVEGGNQGAMNGTTEVTLVAAPASSTRRLVRSLVVANRDTASVTLTVQVAKAASRYTLWSGTLASGSTWNCDTVMVLDATDESIVAKLGGVVATTNPDFHSSYADAS